VLFRKGLKMLLEEAPDMAVAGEAGTGQEALDKAFGGNYDIVLLDISMPGRSGLDVLKDFKKHRPGLPVLILTMHPEEQYALRVLRAGAAGYLTKKNAPEELVTAIRKVMSGRKYVSPALAENLANEIERGAEKLPHETLSDREYEVLLLIASGESLTEIASELNLSINTISTYRARIMEKMSLRNNAELIHYVIEHRLL
jgi:DNA-binding NarL/FixJ family response regulator